MNFLGGDFTNRKGLVGVAKTGIVVVSVILLITLFLQFVLPGFATTTSSIPTSIDISTNDTSYGTKINVSINNSDLGDNNNIIEMNITFDPAVFEYVSASNWSSNTSTSFNATNAAAGNLSWANTTVDGWIYKSENASVSFNLTVINKTHMSRTLTLTVRYDNQTLRSSTVTLSVNDDVSPVINQSTIEPHKITSMTGAYTNSLTATIFEINLTEDNPGFGAGSENVTLHWRKFTSAGGGSIHKENMPCQLGSLIYPTWICNVSVELTGVSDGDSLGFWFNTTDRADNSGVNGTQDANFTLVVDTTKPIIKDPIKNNTGDLKSTTVLNLSVTVTDTNRNDTNDSVVASGNTGATNVSMPITSNNAFNISLIPSNLGCPTASVCTITFYAVDNALNINSTTLTILVDDITPNVTDPYINDTDATVKGSDVFRINVTTIENFNISNVTFTGGTTLGGINATNGNWSIDASADDLGCTADEGTCRNMVGQCYNNKRRHYQHLN